MTIYDMVTSVGFPIAMCIVLLWYINKILENHAKETEGFTKALNRNSNILNVIAERLKMTLDDDSEEREE